MRASKLTALQTAMQQREQRHRTDRKRRAALRWRAAARKAAREREEFLLRESQNRELTIEESFELAGDPTDWRPCTSADLEAMRLQPGDLQPFSLEELCELCDHVCRRRYAR